MTQLVLDLQPGDEQLFVGESLEQIEQLEQGLLAMEHGTPDARTVNEVFRAAHTLKGSAATIRHTRMAELTHAAENVLGALREGRVDRTAPFMDALLGTVDVLRVLVEEVSSGEELTDRAEPLARELTDLLTVAIGDRAAGPPASTSAAAGGARGSTPADARPSGPADARPSGTAAPDADAPSPPAATGQPAALLRAHSPAPGSRRSLIRCVAAEESPWKGVRLLQAFLEADEAAVLIASHPARDDLEAGIETPALWLLVSVAGDDAILLRERIALIDELTVDLVPTPTDAGDEQAPSPATTGTGGAGDAPPAAATSAGAAAGATPADHRPLHDRRQVDLGPEARDTSPEERLAWASDRLRLSQQTIRIDVGRLDELMNLVGELVVLKTRLQRQARAVEDRLGRDDALAAETQASAQQYGRIAGQLQDEVTRLRMLPIATVFNRFPRVVRDLSARLGKEVELVLEGQETELDRSVLEQVGDPLGHLIRNAIDHGIETPGERRAAGKPSEGRLRLAAWHAEGRITIVVEDDGQGVSPDLVRAAAVAKGLLSEATAAALSDQEAIEFIFAPGFSTARAVTEVSGRGVGTDVVRTNIERLGGHVAVHSELGRGTRFELSLPLTLAIMPALLVRAGGRVCALPLTGVVETVRLRRAALSSVHGRQAVVLRGRALPVRRLEAALGDHRAAARQGTELASLVVVRSGATTLALDVDALLGDQEIVLKSLVDLLGARRGIAGATVLPDGSVALVVDIEGLTSARDLEPEREVRLSA